MLAHLTRFLHRTVVETSIRDLLSFHLQSLEELNETAVGLRYFRNLTYDGIDAPRNHLILVEPKVIRNTSDCIINVCEMNGQPGSILFSPVVGKFSSLALTS